jgi:hypothetical protein
MKENRVILLVVILFVLIALGSIIYALINSGESINPFSNSGNSDKGNSGTEISDNNQTSGGSSGGDESGGSSGGGGTSGGTSSGISNTSCPLKQISYSLENPEKNEICNSYSGETCTDKTIDCSIDLRNLDSVGGDFGINIVFVETGKNPITEGFETKSTAIIVGAGEAEKIQASININQEELLNKEIECFYYTTLVPQKEVC